MASLVPFDAPSQIRSTRGRIMTRPKEVTNMTGGSLLASGAAIFLRAIYLTESEASRKEVE